MNYELFSEKNEKIVGGFKIETPKNIWIDDFTALRSEAYSFQCNDKNTNKLRGISEALSKHIKSDEYKKCLDGDKYRKECDNYI